MRENTRHNSISSKVALLIIVNRSYCVLKFSFGGRLVTLLREVVFLELILIRVLQIKTSNIANLVINVGLHEVFEFKRAHMVGQSIFIPFINTFLEKLHGFASWTDVEDHEEDDIRADCTG